MEKLDAPRTYPSREDPSKTYYKRELGLADAGGTSTVKLWSEELGACDEAFGKVIGVTAVAVDKGDGTNAGTAKTHAVYKSTTSSQIVMSPPVPVTEEFRLWLKNEFAADLEDVGLAADEPTA
ncbi:hypothetical protein [Silvimonas sp.]|uniref:hypothetical protein n=1 Tax=Silvimonas sp. TaxID=2650811 RepID=UPI002851A048|nr:hypothetical protein [Silvimonas sp.]MDR3426089.1 hypothetical protein [Silvimonas sp.]